MPELLAINVGFGRTGTLSLKAALDQLGYGPTYHMVEAAKEPGHLDMWADFALGKAPMDWDTLFANYRSSADCPASQFYRELMVKYPNAKLILTLRDPNDWYDSVRESVLAFSDELADPGFIVGLLFPVMRRFIRMADAAVWDKLHGCPNGRQLMHNRELTIHAFNRLNNDIIATVPADRLLIFRVKEGWDPLCKFLQLPAPETPFPHVNDREEFQAQITSIRRVKFILNYDLPALTIIGVAIWRFRRLF